MISSTRKNHMTVKSDSARIRSGLVPGDELEKSMKCIVKIYTNKQTFQKIEFDVSPDDTLLDIKKRVVSLKGATKATSSSELYAWQTLVEDAKSTTERIIDAAMDSGGTNVIGPRIVSVSHLMKVFSQLTGNSQQLTKGAHHDLHSFLTWQEALRLMSKLVANVKVSVPLGLRYELGWNTHKRVSSKATVMTANPFDAVVSVDPNMASTDGDVRDVYTTHTEQDSDTVETIFRRSMGVDKVVILVEMTSIHDVWAHVLKNAGVGISHDGLRVGFVRKYFPSGSSWMRVHQTVKKDEEAYHKEMRLEKQAFLSSDRAILETHDVLDQKSSSVERCVLTHVSIHYRASDALSRASLNESEGYNLLNVIYTKFKVSRDVPVIRYHNGYTSSYKVSSVALTTNHQEVKSYLAKCARVAASTSQTKVKASIASQRQSLYFLVTLGHGDVVTVHLRQDMSYDVIRHFPSSSVNGGGAFEDVARSHSIVSRKVIHTLQGIVVGTNASSVVVVDEKLEDWDDLYNRKSLIGTTVSFGTISTVNVNEGKVPSIKVLRDVVDRMFPFFVPVTIPGNGNSVIFMQYRRVDRFSQTDGLLQTLRVIRDDPSDVMIKKVARAFGITEADASKRIDAELVNGKVPFIPAFLQSGTTVTLSSSQRGILCKVTGSTSAVQHRRIMRLVALAVSVATRDDRKFLSWVFDTSRPLSSSFRPIHDQRKHAYLEDWEEEEDLDNGDKTLDGMDEKDNDELDALLAAELGTNDQGFEITQGIPSPVFETMIGDEQRSQSLSVTLGPPSHDAILKQIQRSDPSLFNFKGSKYSTKCGKVDGRQPIVVTKYELSQMQDGAHTGALAYGTTGSAAKNNRFICPDVWCPRSRTGMSFKQFSDKQKKCPIDDELPIVADNKYFMGKSRYPGFLNPSQHPDGMCMPCCFRLPNQRVGTCANPNNPGFFEVDDMTSLEDSKARDMHTEKEEDPRYLRNFKAPLDDGRYGLLSRAFIDLLGNKQRCGSREDGSGQMGMHTNCFVRRGTARHTQSFISSIVWILDNPVARDIKGFVSLVEANLTPDVFVTLNDGRLASAIMRDVTSNGLRISKEGLSRFASWISSSAARKYVNVSKLMHIVGEAKSFLSTMSGSLAKSSTHLKQTQFESFQKTTMEFKREYVLFAAMLRFFDLLRDPSIVKGHEHLMDLCTRPLKWMNPMHKNVLLFENDGAEGDDTVYFTCPFDGGQLERRLRLSDPIALLVRKGDTYHPIVKVQMSRRDGIVEQGIFFYDVDRFVHQLVYRVLEGCKSSRSTLDVVGSLLIGLVAVGEKPSWQILDFDMQMVGILTESLTYIALPNVTSPLVGEAASHMGTVWISDAITMVKGKKIGAKTTLPDLLERLERVTGIHFTSPEIQKPLPDHVMLNHLGVFVGIPITDGRTSEKTRQEVKSKEDKHLVDRFRTALWEDANAASELAFLRHGFNPLPPSIRRSLMSRLVGQALSGARASNNTHSNDSSKDIDPCNSKKGDVSRLTESLLYDEDPFQSRTLSPYLLSSTGILVNAIMLSDSDLLSTPLEELLISRHTSLDGPPSGVESLAMPGTRVNRDPMRSTKSSVPHSGSGSLVSLRKSLFDPASHIVTSHHLSESHVVSVIQGTRMIRCHPWRALSLAHQLVHTDLRMPVETPMLVMIDDWIGQGKKPPSPQEQSYVPTLRDVEILSNIFSISVMTIENHKIVFDHRTSDDLCMVLAHLVGNKWYVVLDDIGRMLWKNDMANKIHARLQKRGVI